MILRTTRTYQLISFGWTKGRKEGTLFSARTSSLSNLRRQNLGAWRELLSSHSATKCQRICKSWGLRQTGSPSVCSGVGEKERWLWKGRPDSSGFSSEIIYRADSARNQRKNLTERIFVCCFLSGSQKRCQCPSYPAVHQKGGVRFRECVVVSG